MKTLRSLALLSFLIPALSHGQQAPPAPTDVEALHRAAYEGNLKAVNDLISKGTQVDARDPDDRTPMMWAGFNGHTAVVGYLLENGAAINARDSAGRTTLLFASSGPFAETVKLLLDRGADVNHKGSLEGFTALMTAAAEGQLKVAQLLLTYGADPAIKDVDGDTAESFAEQKGHSEVVALLRNPPPATNKP